MFPPGKILIFGAFVALGYVVFPEGLSIASAHRPPSPAASATTFCMVEHYFQFRELVQQSGLNALSLRLDPCDPVQIMSEWSR
jgi:hypothetical protein